MVFFYRQEVRRCYELEFTRQKPTALHVCAQKLTTYFLTFESADCCTRLSCVR